MDLMIVFIITCILFICSAVALIQIRSCSISTPHPPGHEHQHDCTRFMLAVAIMILSGILVIVVGYMIQKPVDTPSQFLGTDTCEEPTCSDGPTLGSENMYGVSAFEDSEYDI
jgi:hypothetical protein